MKTINNNIETMNAPQVLSDNELNNVAGGGFWTTILWTITPDFVKRHTAEFAAKYL